MDEKRDELGEWWKKKKKKVKDEIEREEDREFGKALNKG